MCLLFGNLDLSNYSNPIISGITRSHDNHIYTDVIFQSHAYFYLIFFINFPHFHPKFPLSYGDFPVQLLMASLIRCGSEKDSAHSSVVGRGPA